MKGLFSIALAAAHLDEVEGRASRSQACVLDSQEVQQEAVVPVDDAPALLTGMAFPQRRTFLHGIPPRTVSADSTTSLMQNASEDCHQDDINNEDEEIVFETHSDPPPPPPSPTEIIAEIKEDDVLCGRGGETNHHPGNVRYRALVKQYQRLYLKAKRRDKPKIARQIVDNIRRRHGRFLKKDSSSSTWRDVGNNKAREKTSQALREGAPELRNEDGTSGDEVSSNQTPYQPQVVEAEPGDYDEVVPRPFKTQGKKRKFLQIAQRNSVLHLTTATLVSPTPSSTSLQESYTSQVFPVSISADDDDQGSENSYPTGPASKKSIRGPRLAILKARLMSSEAS